MFCTFKKVTLPPAIYKEEPELTENIFRLVPDKGDSGPKPPRYRSIHNDAVKEFYESVKSPHKTMGYFHTPLAPPTDYLKKHSKEPKLEKPRKPFTYPDEERRKPPVPTLEEMLPKPAEPTKNFIKENVRNAIRTAPRKPLPKIVDTKNGDIIVLEFSGLVPKYCMKKEFGVTPKYLVKRNADMDYDKKCFRDFIDGELLKISPQRLTEDGRCYLLKGLKENWTKLHREYLGLPFMTDTLRKKVRKERMEDQLRSLEQDIELLERHDEIFVVDTYKGW